MRKRRGWKGEDKKERRAWIKEGREEGKVKRLTSLRGSGERGEERVGKGDPERRENKEERRVKEMERREEEREKESKKG